jgi:hypothetical protein
MKKILQIFNIKNLKSLYNKKIFFFKEKKRKILILQIYKFINNLKKSFI